MEHGHGKQKIYRKLHEMTPHIMLRLYENI